jgi:hypothetical protein
LFETVTKASFLDVKNKEDIDWDKIVTSKSEELDVKCSDTHAMPPPKSYDSQSPALKPTLGDTTVVQTSRKRHAGNEDDSDETVGVYSHASISNVLVLVDIPDCISSTFLKVLESVKLFEIHNLSIH